jgi:hypothetical protein
MTTHNISIYHCLSCGRIVHAELNAKPPHCCGHVMTQACNETISDKDDPSAKVDRSSERPPAVLERSQKSD